MKNVRVALIGAVVALAFTLGACGGDGIAAKYSKLVDEVCKCADTACIKKVEAKRDKLATGKKPSESDIKKIEPLDKKWKKCARAIEKKGDDKKSKVAPATKTDEKK